MQYRQFGKLDFKVSALGFGCMRFPFIGEDKSKIDEKEAIFMLRHAIDRGLNYTDTAFPYHDGQSEILVGKALKDGYRQKTKLASKLPSWLISSKKDFNHYLNLQLKKLQTDHLDFYLLHALNQTTWPLIRDLDVLPWAESAIKDGRLGHLGFSFHDQLPLFKQIVDVYDKWAFCQIQYNLLDVDFQAGLKGLRYASAKGLAVVIMEPLKGGTLANPPALIKDVYNQVKPVRTPVDWALQWLWHQPEVSTVLSGMSTRDQVKQNLASADRSAIGSLSVSGQETIKKVQTAYKKVVDIPCTACRYCQPCPQTVNIPKVFSIYNHFLLDGNLATAKKAYSALPEAQKADKCVNCGQCTKACPQNIDIPTHLATIHQKLS